MGVDLDYSDIEWFALEMNRDHSANFEMASKYYISDSFVDYDGYPISSKGFLPHSSRYSYLSYLITWIYENKIIGLLDSKEVKSVSPKGNQP